MTILKIPYDLKVSFHKRLNRFVGEVILPSGKIEKVHIHDTARLKELLFEGNQILIKRANNLKNRKTRWDLLCAKYKDYWVFINSAYHSRIAKEIILNSDIGPFKDVEKVIPEVGHGGSRLDFLVKTKEKEIWVEVKGCTLAKGEFALFPDAPTLRGRRHLLKLIELKESGKEVALIFLVFHRDVKFVSPNRETDLEFSFLLEKAYRVGVRIFSYKIEYVSGNLIYRGRLGLRF